MGSDAWEILQALAATMLVLIDQHNSNPALFTPHHALERDEEGIH